MLDSVVENGHTFEECKQVLKQSAFRSFSLSLRSDTVAPAPLAWDITEALPRLLCVANLGADDWGLLFYFIADIKLDPGFREFYRYCRSNDIPVVIVSRSVNN